jgi:hypothetical protein
MGLNVPSLAIHNQLMSQWGWTPLETTPEISDIWLSLRESQTPRHLTPSVPSADFRLGMWIFPSMRVVWFISQITMSCNDLQSWDVPDAPYCMNHGRGVWL